MKQTPWFQQRSEERGSSLVATLFLSLAVGALVFAHLTKVLAEHRRQKVLRDASRALAAAEGELQRAMNVVASAPYAADQRNTALLAAIDADPPYVPGTTVTASKVGPAASRWYTLRASGTVAGITRTAQVSCRESTPSSSYYIYVQDHPAGISGRPRGTIHTNKRLDFFFPNGTYQDEVTAGEGFGYQNGATEANTHVLGPNDGAASTRSFLDDVDITEILPRATWSDLDPTHEFEVRGMGTSTEIKVYKARHQVTTTRIENQWQIAGWEVQMLPQPQHHYVDQLVEVTVTDWGWIPRWYRWEFDGTRTVTNWVWVLDPSSGDGEGGVIVAGGASGHWEPVTSTVEDWSYHYYDFAIAGGTSAPYWGAVGSHQEWQMQSVYSHTTWHDVATNVPIWVQVPVTVTETVWIPRTLIDTQTVPTDQSILYTKGRIRQLHGDVVGRLAIASEGTIKLEGGSLVQKDPHGNQRMVNGDDPTKPFQTNPAYQGTSAVSVMAKGDVLLGDDLPNRTEIDAAIVSTDGSMLFEGLSVDASGENVTLSVTGVTKESLRFLGGIVCRKRPVQAFIRDGVIVHGFTKGAAIMDPNLLLRNGGNVTPPFVFEAQTPMFTNRMAGRTFEPES
jgi:Tfp pilus assembly protein PilX